MSCKCDGIVRYDSVKKKLLYRSGCDWLDVPASALSGEGARPDIDFGDEELPTPPDGNQSQNYACREAYEIMRHLQGIANYGYLQSVKDYTEFVRLTGTPTGIAFKGQVSRYFYDQARKPENAQAFQELAGDDTQRDIFVCQLAEALTKGPGWTTDDDVALYDLIQGMSSIPKLIYTYALHLTDTNELNDIATAAAYDESVPCPCNAEDPFTAPDRPSLATWGIEADLKTHDDAFYNLIVDAGAYVALRGIDQSIDTEKTRSWVWIALNAIQDTFIERVDVHYENVVFGSFWSDPNGADFEIEGQYTRWQTNNQEWQVQTNRAGWNSRVIGKKLTLLRQQGWFAYDERDPNAIPDTTGRGTLTKVRMWGRGTIPAAYSSWEVIYQA